MLSCELCCSFRAARQVHLSLLQQNSYSPLFFSSGALSQGVRALPCCHGLRFVAVGFALLPSAPPCCHGLRLAVLGSALLLWAPPCCHAYFPVVLFI